MSATLIPEADPELVSKLEKTGETDKLEDILEETEISREYDIGYRNNSQKTSEHSGTFYTPSEVSPYYRGSEPELHIPIETNINEFYANLDGEFRLIDNEGEDRTYKLVMSCEHGMFLKGEVGFGEREITDFRYIKGDEESNKLQVYLDGNWCGFGKADEIGKGNETMKHIELIESAYKQLNDNSKVEDQSWEIVYSSSMEEDLEKLPPQISSTVDNKTNAFEQNLELGVKPENMLSAMSQPWKPLLEMRLGSDYRAMFIAGSNLSKEDISEKYRGNRKIIGLSIEPKKEFKEKFRTESGNQIENVTEYALNSL